MLRFFKKNPTSRLRAIRAYLLIVLITTLLLFAFSVVSLYEQRIRSQQLSSSNLRFNGEQIALDIEQRMAVLAEDCLNAEVLKNLKYNSAQAQSLQTLKTYREQLDALRKLHPIAEYFFIFDANGLVFPRITLPASQTPASMAPAPHTAPIKNYLELFSRGARAELIADKSVQAAGFYRNAAQLAVPNRLKALALFRTAQALNKSGQKSAALEIYRWLLRSYGDQYDQSQTPYVLSLSALPEEWTRPIFQSDSQSLYYVYRDLMDGKWELSAQQVESHLDRLERRLHLAADNRTASIFLDHIHSAEALKEEVEFGRLDPPFQMASSSFRHNTKPYQIYMKSFPVDGGHNIIIGFSVSLSWLNDFLIPTYARESQYRAVRTVSLVDTLDLSDETNSEGEIYASFSTVLPFWKLLISFDKSDLNATDSRRETFFVGLSVIMFLMALGLGSFLFIRVSWDIRAFQLRSDFVSGVSHEFKTPLSLIRLYSESLAGNEDDFSPEDRSNYIRIIARESERLSRLINNVLDFSKLEKKRTRSELPEGNLADTIAQAIQDYSDYLMWKGFALKSSIQPQLPPVRFDPEQVSQMLVNLLDNARKYSGTSRIIRLNAWAQGHEVIVEVQDNGIGIPAEEKERIFQPFYRVPNAKEKGGCGLGLYLVAQVMKEHRGRVEVESEVNQGSRFRLVFPVSGSRQADAKFYRGKIGKAIPPEQQAQDLS